MRQGIWVALLGPVWMLSGCSALTSNSDDTRRSLPDKPPLAENLDQAEQYKLAVDMASYYLNTGETERAYTVIERLVERSPERIEGIRLLVDYYLAVNDQDMAVVAAKEAYKHTEATDRDASRLARLSLLNQQPETAREIYQAWSKSDDSTLQTKGLNNLGIVAMSQKRYDLARRYFENALALDPLSRKARNNLKLLNAMQGSVDTAEPSQSEREPLTGQRGEGHEAD
ncbi:MAG: tetratricopeptide repeat protein [Hydrogenovibrio sp.]|uniref:tetratricopeptide repeat protein n=1 Tax=Hydrogenovibrio sp. TaxID=2065821 RepID=UPI00286FB5D8|nr:tetratricopeptide repeat protein [Hydrogenovibrio sp.]MDR9497580.1 tetratricopeptide repeat protein [Hydrogenovibrio sp.]